MLGAKAQERAAKGLLLGEGILNNPHMLNAVVALSLVAPWLCPPVSVWLSSFSTPSVGPNQNALSPGARSVRELGEVILQAQTNQF